MNGDFVFQNEVLNSINDDEQKKNEIEENPSKEKITNISDRLPEFFSNLREAHLSDVFSQSIPNDVQHVCLKPTLREYQANAVRWMVNREITKDYFPSEYFEVVQVPEYIEVFTEITNQYACYYNPITNDLTFKQPQPILIPSGGILADEMGLGKTIEVLAMILLNKRTDLLPIAETIEIKESEEENFDDNAIINCICLSKKRQNVVKCPKCLTCQHKHCVFRQKMSKKNYICPNCWQYESPVPSSSTLIVTPYSIKEQWRSEIEKHTSLNLKVYIYDGVKSFGWINPNELAQYDVVLTDYQTLRAEIYFAQSAQSQRHNFRHKAVYMRPVSPLPLIEWWRVCLDEAQMVETTTTKSAIMVRSLPAVHRWSITGTPIEKKFDNLYGLLYFIDCYPYTEMIFWQYLLAEYLKGNSVPIVDVLKRIMWRTCKSGVLEQINIPQQTEVIHKLKLSDVETLNYKIQHSKYSIAFHEKAVKLSTNLSMSHMNSHTLKLMMEPLRKIRQDCSIPSVLKKNDPLRIDQILSPDQLLKYMIGRNEIDCKVALRTIVSNMNGIAAIHVMLEEYDKAIEMYEAVLKRCKEYTGTICVDSLLQIHAIYNLQFIYELQNKLDEKANENYNKTLADLEWKFIDARYTLVKTINNQLTTVTQVAIDKIHNEMSSPMNNGNWWRECTYSPHFNEKVVNGSFIMQRYTSIHGVDYVLTTWWDKVIKERDVVLKGFDKIKYFYENLRKENEMTAEELQRIEKLIQLCCDCHFVQNVSIDYLLRIH